MAKIIKAIAFSAFPFSKHYTFLAEKWWHRLFVVVYCVTMLGFLVVAFIVSQSSISERPFNVTIKNNLNDFTKGSNVAVANTVPLFLAQGNVGCLEKNEINYASTYSLENDSFCSADISSHLNEAADKVFSNYDDLALSSERRVSVLSQLLTEDTEKRYCFMPKSVGCSSHNIIIYNRNAVFYLQAALYALAAGYALSLILQFCYFKGLIYIVFGKKSA